MRKGIKIGLAVVMVLSIIGLGAIGCGQPAPTPTPTPIPTPTPTPTPTPEKVYKLKYADMRGPSEKNWEECYADFERLCEERSNGRLQIDIYPNQSLCTGRGSLDAMRTGVCEISGISPTYFPGYFDRQQVLMLPAFWETCTQGSMMYWALFEEFFEEDYTEVGIRNIAQGGFFPYMAFTRDKKIEKWEDFKGVTLRCGLRPLFDLMESVGAIPVSGMTIESYEMMQKGVVDGTVSSPPATYNYRWYEVGKPGYIINAGGLTQAQKGLCITLDAYNALPADLQTIIDEVGFLCQTERYAASEDRMAIEGINFCVNYGTVFVNWTDAEKERFKVMHKDAVAVNWAAEFDAKGEPGTEMVKRLNEVGPGVLEKYPPTQEWLDMLAGKL